MSATHTLASSTTVPAKPVAVPSANATSTAATSAEAHRSASDDKAEA